MPHDHELAELLSHADAERLLRRAAELDRAQGDALRVSLVRQSAVEAGIRPESFDAALGELRRGAAVDAATEPVPFLVRASLIGVPTRDAAMVYYWVFSAGLVLAQVYLFYMYHHAERHAMNAIAINVLLFTLWMFFALWTTSKAVRWLDDRGLRALPPRRPRGA